MALSEKTKEKILGKIGEALKKKDKKEIICPVCSNNQFVLTEGFANVSLSDRFGGIVLGGSTLPNVPIVCNNCGNTFFLNLRVLGFSEEDFKEEGKEDSKENKKNG